MRVYMRMETLTWMGITNEYQRSRERLRALRSRRGDLYVPENSIRGCEVEAFYEFGKPRSDHACGLLRLSAHSQRAGTVSENNRNEYRYCPSSFFDGSEARSYNDCRASEGAATEGRRSYSRAGNCRRDRGIVQGAGSGDVAASQRQAPLVEILDVGGIVDRDSPERHHVVAWPGTFSRGSDRVRRDENKQNPHLSVVTTCPFGSVFSEKSTGALTTHPQASTQGVLRVCKNPPTDTENVPSRISHPVVHRLTGSRQDCSRLRNTASHEALSWCVKYPLRSGTAIPVARVIDSTARSVPSTVSILTSDNNSNIVRLRWTTTVRRFRCARTVQA